MKEFIISKLAIVIYLQHSILPYRLARDSLNHSVYMQTACVSMFADRSLFPSRRQRPSRPLQNLKRNAGRCGGGSAIPL